MTPVIPSVDIDPPVLVPPVLVVPSPSTVIVPPEMLEVMPTARSFGDGPRYGGGRFGGYPFGGTVSVVEEEIPVGVVPFGIG